MTKTTSGSTTRVLAFFAKLLAIYGVWYVVYDLWLLPAGWLDEWVSHSVAEASARVLSLSGLDAAAQGRDVVATTGEAGVRIVNGCNGISTIGLFTGFVLAYPGRWVRRLLFLPVGVGIIYASNVARISILVGFQKIWPDGFAFVHGLGAPTFFYLIVFGLWVIWANWGGGAAGAPSESPEKQQREQTNPDAVSPSAA